MAQIPADANEVIDQLSQQIGTLSKQVAILTSQLDAAMKLIPADVLDTDETMLVGWITNERAKLSKAAETYLEKLKSVVASHGYTLID